MKRNSEKGQAAVEFAIFTLILFAAMFLIVQLVWIALQKWQFNHFASYSARTWSVRKGWGSEQTLLTLQGASAVGTRWDLLSGQWVKYMIAYSESPQDVDDDNKDIPGVSYIGFAPVFSFYKPFLGETLFNNPVPSWIMNMVPFSIPTSGYISFMSFVPIEKEPEEDSDTSNRDNDCDDTPCSSGNGR